MTIQDSDGLGNLLDSDGNIAYIYDSDGSMMYDSDGNLIYVQQDSASVAIPADSDDNILIDEAIINKLYISHRGNLTGPVPELENTPSHIDSAIRKGFTCEVDVWKKNGVLVLSHDEPTDTDIVMKSVEQSFFRERQNKLLIHCKNPEAIIHFLGQTILNGPMYHYFYHDSDAYNITSQQAIIAYPGKDIPIDADIQPLSIAMMPEIHNTDTTNFLGICSDYIENYYNTGA